MKKTIILSIMLITLLPAVSLRADTVNNKAHFLSMQSGLLLKESQYRPYFSYGMGWEYRNKNISYCCDLIYVRDIAILPSLDMAFYFDTRPQRLHLYAGVGAAIIVSYGAGFCPEVFTGGILDLSRDCGIFAKFKFILGEKPWPSIYCGVTFKI